MADGLNMARAMRVTEIMTDFRNIQTYMASIRANPSAEEYNEEGYVVLRRCVADSQRLLTQPFVTTLPSSTTKEGDEEAAKVQLRRVLFDASCKRFQAQKLYLQATAALRWINRRNQLLQGQKPNAGHAPALNQIRYALQQELVSITDQRVEQLLRSADQQQQKWLGEDPSFREILMGIRR